MRRAAIMALLAAGILAGAAQAESRFAKAATVEQVDLQSGFIGVGEGQYWVKSTTRVYTSTGSSGSLQMLRPGMRIRFNLDNTANDWRTISEIRITSNDND